MRAIDNIITYNSGSPTDISETHWVFSNVRLRVAIGDFKEGFTCPTAILHTDHPRLILVAADGKQYVHNLKYSV